MLRSLKSFQFALVMQFAVAVVLVWISFELRSQGVRVAALLSLLATVAATHSSYNLVRRIERAATPEEIAAARTWRAFYANISAILLLIAAGIGAFA